MASYSYFQRPTPRNQTRENTNIAIFQSMGTFSGLNPDRTDMRLGSPVLRNCRTQQFFGANV